MPRDAYAELQKLQSFLAEDDHPRRVAMYLDHLALANWDPYAKDREDWGAIYNAWLLWGEEHRLQFACDHTPAIAQGIPSGNPARIFCYACYGIWSELWDKPYVAERCREWCREEMTALKQPLGPSASVVECFLANKLFPEAAAEWSAIRKKFNRGGMNRAAVHNDYPPFDVLAPELAWCAQAGQTILKTKAIVAFPKYQEYPLHPATEEALVAIASSRWA